MFSKRSYKPFMKGSFSGARGLRSSFISDRCLWGAPLVGLQGAGVTATAFLPTLHRAWRLGLACPASQRAGCTRHTAPKDDYALQGRGNRTSDKKHLQDYLFLHSQAHFYVYPCEKKWLQCKCTQGKCGMRCFIWILLWDQFWQSVKKSSQDNWGEYVSI